MTEWQTLQHTLENARNEKEKKRISVAIQKYIESTSPLELKKIVETTDNELIRQQAENELWWKAFDKEPKKLMELVHTETDKEKINKAITELGRIKYTEAINTIIGFLSDVDIRDSAALALREMPTQKAITPLMHSIRQYPNGAECLLYLFQVLDCSEAAELLVDLFISKPNSPVVRDDILVCFSEKAVKRIPKQVKMSCCSKLLKAIENSENQNNRRELRQLYQLILPIDEV